MMCIIKKSLSSSPTTILLMLQCCCILRNNNVHAFRISNLAPSVQIKQHYHRKLLKYTSSNIQNGGQKLYAKKEATFGMGCFWKPSEELLKVPGVIDTVVGYTGNPSATEAPSYEKVCFSREPWVEGVRVYYDDDVLTYNELLNEFFDKQEPQINSRQYGSIIFVHDNDQRRTAESWLLANERTIRQRDNIPAQLTSVEPVVTFYRAEQYHQQYWQKTRPRIAGMIALLAISTGVLDNYIPSPTIQHYIHTGSNFIVIAGLLFVLFERKIDTKTFAI